MEHDVILRVRTGDVLSLDEGQREKSENAEETNNDPTDWRDRRTLRRVSA